jgi:mRNA interferase HigB
MVIISKRPINMFISKHPVAGASMLNWYEKAKTADWTDFQSLKKTFSSADFVGNDLYVFNIGGNKYRLVARIFFSTRTVYVRFVGTHKEYDMVKLSHL